MDFAHITPPASPSAWLDLDALDANIERVNQMTAKVGLRIASKSIRSTEALHYIRERTPHFVGIMSYSAAESAYLLAQGFDDILCAYPSIDTASIIQTLSFVAQGASMVWMVDRLEQWQLLDEIGRQHGVVLSVCLDINMSMPLPKLYFGTKRSSLITLSQVQDLINRTKTMSHTKLVGLMGYEGQIAGLPEHLPDKAMLTPIIRLLKSFSKKQLATRRQAITDWLNQNGHPLTIVNGGGSGSMAFTTSQPEITEITVGSAYYYPALFGYMDSMAGFRPAAGFVLPVTRHPEDTVIVAHGGGLVASGAMGRDKLPKIIHPPQLEILTDEGFGEVQTPLITKGSPPSIGSHIWLQHAKAGELCERFNELITYRNNQPIGHIRTYRGEGQCFH